MRGIKKNLFIKEKMAQQDLRGILPLRIPKTNRIPGVAYPDKPTLRIVANMPPAQERTDELEEQRLKKKSKLPEKSCAGSQNKVKVRAHSRCHIKTKPKKYRKKSTTREKNGSTI